MRLVPKLLKLWACENKLSGRLFFPPSGFLPLLWSRYSDSLFLWVYHILRSQVLEEYLTLTSHQCWHYPLSPCQSFSPCQSLLGHKDSPWEQPFSLTLLWIRPFMPPPTKPYFEIFQFSKNLKYKKLSLRFTSCYSATFALSHLHTLYIHTLCLAI